MELWHNPRCSKSRATKELLDERGADYHVRLYLEDPPNAAQLNAVLMGLGKQPWEVARLGEDGAPTLAKDPDLRDEWIAAMVAHPVLIERPILVTDDGRAAIGRPPEDVLPLLD